MLVVGKRWKMVGGKRWMVVGGKRWMVRGKRFESIARVELSPNMPAKCKQL